MEHEGRGLPQQVRETAWMKTDKMIGEDRQMECENRGLPQRTQETA